MARAFYDLLKFEAMYRKRKIDAAVLVVPVYEAARALGDNIANFTRVTREITLFAGIITVPCVVIGIDEEDIG